MTAYEELERLFDSEGGREYLGESVTVADHMLLTASAARHSGAAPEMVVACLFHDVGHFMGAMSGLALMEGSDNQHEDIAAQWLGQWFGPEITEPVRLHVAAKRYLCATDASYYDRLSDASKFTMRVQGGDMSAEEVAAFAAEEYADAACQLRRFDDLGKNTGAPRPVLADFRADVDALDRTLAGRPS